MSNFAKALEVVQHHEGGYVNHPSDPGGETIYGISRRSHPDVWAKGRPTLEDAKRIYHRDYWLPIKADDLPFPVALMVFDAAVNAGNRRAVILLQRALRVAAKYAAELLVKVAIEAMEKAAARTSTTIDDEIVAKIKADRETIIRIVSGKG